MQKYMKQITHKKECNIETNHRYKVENVQQYGKVPEQEKVREYNLVNKLVCNGIHGDEVISVQCKEVSKRNVWDEHKRTHKQVPKEKVGMNLLQYTRIFPR